MSGDTWIQFYQHMPRKEKLNNPMIKPDKNANKYFQIVQI